MSLTEVGMDGESARGLLGLDFFPVALLLIDIDIDSMLSWGVESLSTANFISIPWASMSYSSSRGLGLLDEY